MGAIGFAAAADDFLPGKIIGFLKVVEMKFTVPVRIYPVSQFTILCPHAGTKRATRKKPRFLSSVKAAESMGYENLSWEELLKVAQI